jgi:hypothetical protein
MRNYDGYEDNTDIYSSLPSGPMSIGMRQNLNQYHYIRLQQQQQQQLRQQQQFRRISTMTAKSAPALCCREDEDDYQGSPDTEDQGRYSPNC